MNILILEDDEDLAVGIEISLKQENYRFVISNTIKITIATTLRRVL